MVGHDDVKKTEGGWLEGTKARKKEDKERDGGRRSLKKKGPFLMLATNTAEN